MPDGELDDEKHPDDAVVVIEDLDKRWDEFGRYALARAYDWCDTAPEVIAWRGPEKPDEVLKKDNVREVSCSTVLVDANGFFICRPTEGEPRFYPCPVDEDLADDVKETAEELLGDLANERGAESASYVHDELEDDFGGKVWVVATVGDAVAVNGDVLTGEATGTPPRGWVLTDRGGRNPSGGEEEIEKDTLIDMVAGTLSKKGNFVHAWTVRRILDTVYPKDYIMWSSGSGDTEIWTTRRALKKYEALETERARKWEEEKQRRIVEERRRKEEERRAKIRRGGFPGPTDWSPRGLLPGEKPPSSP